MFTETWSNELHDLDVNGFEHFELHRIKSNMSKRDSGGIIIYVKQYLVSDNCLFFTSDDDILWLRLDGKHFLLNDDVFLGLCYVMPEGSSRVNSIEQNTFDRLVDSIGNIHSITDGHCNILLAGDFNSRTSDHPEFVIFDNSYPHEYVPDDYVTDVFCQRHSQDKGHVNGNGTAFLDLCKQTELRILNGRVGQDAGVGKYTFVGHRGSSLVDYVIVSESLYPFMQSFNVHDPNPLSDHNIIEFSFENDSSAYINNAHDDINDEYDATPINCKYVWNDDLKCEYIDAINCSSFIETLDDIRIHTESCHTIDDINENVHRFSNIMENATENLFRKHVKPNKPNSNSSETPVNKYKNAWYNAACESKREDFYTCLNHFRKCTSAENRELLVKARTTYKNVLKSSRRNYFNEQTKQLENYRSKNAKLYWKMLKNASHVKTSTIPLSTFEEYFKAINNPNDHFFNPDEDILHFNERFVNDEFQTMFNELDIEITVNDITKGISQLNNNRSSGPDNLLNEYFKYGRDRLLPYLHSLFNTVFNTGHFPDAWSEGFIIPLHKKGSINNPDNYRGITLLSVLGKLFTNILNTRLKNWAEYYNVYIEAQAGFRSNMSTTDNIFVLHGLITHMINSSKRLYCSFVDFSKAFDYVERNNLWYKLTQLGVRGKMLTVIKSMYSNIKSRVKFQNSLSNDFSCMLGVRQGECLSPFLFSMFLNDIEEYFILNKFDGIDIYMTKLFLLLYADDIVIFSETPVGLQKGLDLLYEYCCIWKLKININKTKILIFRKGGSLQRNLKFTINGETIEIVKSFTYLGIVFSQGGSFSDTQTMLAGKAQKAIFKLNKYLMKFPDVTIKHRLDLFDKLVSPILNYACEVWGFHTASNIERVHTIYCKCILKIKRSTQNDFVYGILGRRNFIYQRHYRIIKYWLKILCTDDHKYCKIIYKMLKNDAELCPNKISWVTLVKDLLSTMGFHYVWLAQGVGNNKLFLHIFKQRLNDNFIQTWNNRLTNSTRARFFRQITVDFDFQYFLSCITITKFRIAFTRLVVSSHKLQIEAGRYHKPHSIPLEDRKCNTCALLEDEYHFLFECSLFTDLRKQYIGKYYWHRPSMFKLKQLFESKSDIIIKKLSIYIFKAFQIRNETIR